MEKILILFISLFIVGCSCNPPALETKDIIVKVPVSVPCKIQPVVKPIMPLDNISVTEDIDNKISNALAEIERRIAYEKELEAVIKECQ